MSSDLIDDLKALRGALTRQLDAIDVEATRLGCRREDLRDTSGAFTASPVLVALATVDVALLERCACEAYTLRTDYGTGIEHDVDRSSCPVHAGDDHA